MTFSLRHLVAMRCINARRGDPLTFYYFSLPADLPALMQTSGTVRALPTNACFFLLLLTVVTLASTFMASRS